MARCEECKAFDSEEDKKKERTVKEAKNCGVICIHRMRDKLTRLQDDNLSDSERNSLGKTFEKYFRIGLDDKDIIKDISSNYKKIGETLNKGKPCNESKTIEGAVTPNNPDGNKRASVCIGEPTEFYLWKGFFSSNYSIEQQSRTLIHEATHEGKLYTDKIENQDEKDIYLNDNGESGFYDEKGIFHKVETDFNDRKTLPDAYAYAAKDGCRCDSVNNKMELEEF